MCETRRAPEEVQPPGKKPRPLVEVPPPSEIPFGGKW